MRSIAHVLIRVALAGGLPAAVGCASTHPGIPTHPAGRPAAAPTARLAAPVPKAAASQVVLVSAAERVEQPAGIDDLLALARIRNPDLAAAAARVGEARGRMVQAGLYPNPTVGYSANQINDGPGTAGQQGGFITQEFVTAGKLRIATDAARAGVGAADWHAASKWFDTAARVRAAYVEAVTARAVLRETEQTAALFAEGLDRTEKLAAGGKAEAYDVTRLRVETTQIANRVGAARQRVAAADRLLAVAVGVDQLPPVADADLSPAVLLPGYDEAVALAGRSSFVLAAAAEAEQAQGELRAAEVKPVPNVHTMTTVAHDYVTRAPMASVQLGVALPVFDRNRGNIAAAQARLVAAEAGVGQARLRTTERLAGAYQRYENARRQLDLYRTRVLPDAAAALEQIDHVYAARGERFFDTLDARRVLTQARIDYAQTLGDLWAAAAEVEAVTQFAR
jgi:outer membrane protein, heavy metal efflux system